MNPNYLRRWFLSYRRHHDPRHRNYQWLATIAKEIGQRYEQMTYQELLEADANFGQIHRDGIAIAYSTNLYDQHENGDLAFCIDLHSDLPTPWGILPAYQFCKRPDGSVHYSG